jgi:PAS domain S-box-containing protein
LTGEDKPVLAEYVSHPALSVKGLPVNTNGYIFHALEESHRTMIVDDVPRFMAEHPQEASTVSLWQRENRNLSQIICPIFVNGDLFGGVVIGQTDHARKWTASEIALIEAVTAQMEVAVSHSQLFEEAKQTARREALISHLTYKINQSNRLDEIFPVVARELGEHLRANSLAIIQFDHQSQTMTVSCEYKNGEVVKPNACYDIASLTGMRAFLDNGLIVSNDVERDARVKVFLDKVPRRMKTRALMVAPLYYKGTPRFAIAAIMTSGPRVWREEEKDLLREAAEQVFTAFERAALFEQVSHGKFEWESTFDALTDGIFIFDQNGTLRRVNAAAAAFEGAQINSLLGRQCCTLLQGIESEQCRVAEVIETGRPVTFELVPERLRRPVLVTISPLSAMADDSRPGAIGAVCIVRDLSELRAAEAVAREQRNFLVKLIEHATDAIFALSPDGRFIWFNEQLTALSGYWREELKEGHYQRFLPAGEKLKVTRRFLRALKGEAQTFEMQAISKSGEQRLLLVTYTPIYDEGRITSVLSIARDITEDRLESERAAQADKLRALGQLASGVAHNFNNILAAILGHTQLMKRDCRDEHSLERLDIIERAAIDGAETVKRIQGFGLHQEGAIAELIDVNQLVQDSTTLTQARWRDDAQARGLRYQVEVDLRSVPLIRGSASELREVFVNIILNALDAMPAGGRLKISTDTVGQTVQIGFADTGKGMPREVREHIFEPFFTTKGADGMGLGLAVSYSIVERHGGKIEVASEQGQGSIFIITLPAAKNVRAEARRRHTLPVKTANILVIDDDNRVREAMAGMLDAAGHRTHQASSGREGLSLMEQRGFDIVFTDLSMPETDGWAVANEIRRRWPDVKVVLMTGYAVSPETIDHYHHLVDHVIIKPIRFEEINAALCKVTNGH